jgi:ribonuclease HI
MTNNKDKDKLFTRAMQDLSSVFSGTKAHRAGSLIDELKSLYHKEQVGLSVNKASQGYDLPQLKAGASADFYAFSDGACRGNPGPGAWGVVVQDKKGSLLFEKGEFAAATTNNRMELMGAIKALEFVLAQNGQSVCLGSDSKYVLDGLQSWMAGWKKRGWKKADKKEPENLDLWKRLDKLKEAFTNFHCLWIKGHSGHPQNERCDELANEALDEAGH